MRTIGKNRGIARLADADGHFRMVALDRRPPLSDAIAQARGITREQVEYSDVTAAKRLLVEALAPHCSSMLFDPNFAVPAAIDLLPARCGLIMTLEEHRVEETAGGRKSRAIPKWSVGKIRAMGGDALKVLSGGAAPDRFERVLDYAYAAGAGGFLAGRTIWLDAVRRHFPDRKAVAASLRRDGVAVLDGLSDLTKAKAKAWTAHFPGFGDIKQEGDFARAY